MIGAGEREMLWISAETTVLTALAVGPSIAVMIWYDWGAETPLALIATGVAMGIALWLAAIAWLRHPLFNELQLGLAALRHRA